MAEQPVYSVTVIAEILGIGERRIQQLVKEGVLIRGDRGKYPLTDNVRAYIKYWEDKAKGMGNDTSINDERYRLLKAQADSQEQKNLVERSELLPVDYIRQIAARVAVQLSSILDTMPARLKRIQPSLNNQAIDVIKADLIEMQVIMSDMQEVVDQVFAENV